MAHLSQLTPALHQDPTSKAWRYNQILLILIKIKVELPDSGMLSENYLMCGSMQIASLEIYDLLSFTS